MSLTLHLEGGEQRSVTGQRFTIGRAQENDWVLPDPEQHLSRQHCVIERRGGGFCVVDTSSNGVFVNGSTTPLGRGSERGLSNGDRLQLGSYVIAVALQGAAEPAPTAGRGKMFDPTHLPKAAPKEGAGRVFDGTWVGSREELGAADHRITPMARPDPRFQTAPDHRPVDLGKIADDGLFDSAPAEQPPSTPAAPPAEPAPPAPAPEGGLFDSSQPPSPRPQEPVQSPAAASTPDDAVQAKRDLFDSDEPCGAQPPEQTPADPVAAPDSLDPFAEAPAPPVVEPVTPAPPAAPPATPTPPAVAVPPTPAPVAPALPVAPPPEAAPPPAAAVAPPSQPAEPAPPPAEDARLLEAFLEGAGFRADSLSIEDREAFMRAAGARLRDLTEGLVQLLAARASIKNVARVERTTIGRDLNNPLKYAVTPAEALQAVLEGRGPGFLSPEAAVRGGFRDIQEHEMALLDGMQVALRALLQRFEPESFERQLEAENLFATLVAGGRRAKCWDAFKARYAQIASEAEREFLGEVGADFARSYEARTRRM